MKAAVRSRRIERRRQQKKVHVPKRPVLVSLLCHHPPTPLRGWVGGGRGAGAGVVSNRKATVVGACCSSESDPTPFGSARAPSETRQTTQETQNNNNNNSNSNNSNNNNGGHVGAGQRQRAAAEQFERAATETTTTTTERSQSTVQGESGSQFRPEEFVRRPAAGQRRPPQRSRTQSRQTSKETIR